MGFEQYESDKIWIRLNKKLDLKKFKAAKTEQQRRKAFKTALKKDQFGKNILKMQQVNFKRVFDFGVAQQSLDDGKEIEASIKRFTPKRQKTISALKGQLRTLKDQENLFRKAERKGITVRAVKEKVTAKGRPTKEKVKLEGVTFSKSFKLGKRTVRGIYKKGRRGAIALEEVG